MSSTLANITSLNLSLQTGGAALAVKAAANAAQQVVDNAEVIAQTQEQLNDLLSYAGIDPDFISYVTGDLPNSTGAIVGTIGAYFNDDGAFVRLEWNGANWVEAGEAISTYEHVSDFRKINQGVFLQNWKASVAKWATSKTYNPSIMLLGDSWIGDGIAEPSDRTRLSYLFSDKITRIFGYHGSGFFSTKANSNGCSHYTADETVSSSQVGTWTLSDEQPTSLGLNAMHIKSTDVATPAKVTLNSKTDTTAIDVWYYKVPNGGSFRWRVNTGSWTTVDTNDTVGLGVLSITGLTGFENIELEVTVAGTEGVTFLGFRHYCDTTTGATVHRVGNGGAEAVDYADTNESLWESQFAEISPDLCVICLQTNDREANVSIASFTSSMQTIIDRIRSASPKTDIVLFSALSAGSGTIPVSDYAGALQRLALLNSCLFVSALDIIGSYTEANSNGLMFDTLHTNQAGSEAICDAIIDRVLLDTGLSQAPLSKDRTGGVQLLGADGYTSTMLYRQADQSDSSTLQIGAGDFTTMVRVLMPNEVPTVSQAIKTITQATASPNNSGNTQIGIRLSQSGGLGFLLGNTSTQYTILMTASNRFLGMVCDIVVVRKNGKIGVFINNAPLPSIRIAGTEATAADSILSLLSSLARHENQTGTPGFSSYYYKSATWRRALSRQEISDLYNDVQVSLADALYNQDLSEFSGYILPDISSMQFDGVYLGANVPVNNNRIGRLRVKTTTSGETRFKTGTRLFLNSNIKILSILAKPTTTPATVDIGDTLSGTEFASAVSLTEDVWNDIALSKNFSGSGYVFVDVSAVTVIDWIINYEVLS